jgi:tRNA (guanine-N7-)-methyltransferase
MSRRIRKHANPFTVQTVLGRLDRKAWFGREAPLEVDLGCAGAGLIFERARHHPERDFVGIEVRKPLVQAAMARREREGPKNVAVFWANANVNVNELAEPGTIVMFHVHFPDPCFKKKHHKRRILQPRLVRDMAEVLPIGGQVYLQSDVRGLAEEMYRFMAADGAFSSKLGENLRVERPIPESTEWERQHEREGEAIYRMLFEKTAEPSGPVAEPEFADVNPLRTGENVPAASGSES